MKIVVLGAGIVGVTTAWELLRDGHDVTLVDRHPAAAAETSFANGGQISPSHADPWAAPGSVIRALRWMLDPAAPLKLVPSFDLAQLGWFGRFAANLQCPASRREHRTHGAPRALQPRPPASVQQRREVDLQPAPDRPVAHLPAMPRRSRRRSPRPSGLPGLGCERLPVSVDECIAIEPALKPVADWLAGGFTSPGDESGDARLFAQRLTKLARKKGLVLRLGETVEGLDRDGGRIRAVRLAGGEPVETEAVVCALGAFSTPFMRGLGVMLPVQPAKGYSITVPAKPARAAPKVALIDDARKLVFSRLGGSVRIAGMAEFAGLRYLDPGAAAEGAGAPRVRCAARAASPPGRGRRSPVLGGPQAADPGRRAGDFADTGRGALSQYRAWHARLDHGDGLRPPTRRHHRRPCLGPAGRRIRAEPVLTVDAMPILAHLRPTAGPFSAMA